LRMPFVPVMVPLLASGFSLLQFVLFLNMAFAYRIVRRGDFALYSTLMASSTCPKLVSWLQRLHARSGGVLAVEVVCIMVLGGCGLLALRSKFLYLHFVSTVSIARWDFWSVLAYMGFVNQVASMFHNDYFEFTRLLVFKFGGRDGLWSPEAMREVPEYFGLLFSRFVSGRVNEHRYPGLVALAAFVTFNSCKFQVLLLSKERRTAIKDVHTDRCDVMGAMLSPEILRIPVNHRAAALQVHMEALQSDLAAEAARCTAAAAAEDRHADAMFMRLAEKKRLMALVQSHMAEAYAESKGRVCDIECGQDSDGDGDGDSEALAGESEDSDYDGDADFGFDGLDGHF